MLWLLRGYGAFVEAGRLCPLCAADFPDLASRGRLSCRQGHTFVMDTDLINVRCVDGWPESAVEEWMDQIGALIRGLDFNETMAKLASIAAGDGMPRQVAPGHPLGITGPNPLNLIR